MVEPRIRPYALHAMALGGIIAIAALLAGCGSAGPVGNSSEPRSGQANEANQAQSVDRAHAGDNARAARQAARAADDAARSANDAARAARESAVAVRSWPQPRFDLICDGRGRVAWETDEPTLMRSPNDQQWESSIHEIVDLAAMRHCDPDGCRRVGPDAIQEVKEDSILFVQSPTNTISYNRRTGRWHRHSFELERLDVEDATCRVAPFSGFPAIAPQR
jgi:hypothetical protein